MKVARRMVIEVIDDDIAALWREKTPAQPLAASNAMWQTAYDRTVALVRHLYPEWDCLQFRSEVCRSMLGSNWFAAADRGKVADGGPT